ncbi:MAG TPA: TetR/AcrR family transcriptional regulator [Tepidisphaeraceae bacterium]|nr:TetR/AcrR family transcriptional regulator [Tepidisphaeraceae bacterium]
MGQKTAEAEGGNGLAMLAKGQRSRQAILTTAASLATTHGLHGLSIGDLAGHLNMSKSGLYAHFKSKEELELATIDTAAEIFEREVLAPAALAPPGVRRIRALVDHFLGHLERKVFPGGCFFAAVAAELDTRPGPTRDRVAKVLGDWMALLTRCLEDARVHGEIDRKIDIPQTAFEANSLLTAANFMYVMSDNPAPLVRARKGIDNLLARATPRERRAGRG